MNLLSRNFPALVGQLESRNLIRLRYAVYCRSNVSELALYIGSFRPGREVCDLIGVADLALRTCSHRHRLRPFHNRIDRLISIAEAGALAEDSGGLLKIFLACLGRLIALHAPRRTRAE